VIGIERELGFANQMDEGPGDPVDRNDIDPVVERAGEAANDRGRMEHPIDAARRLVSAT
jgi:hypothetical protein